MKGIDKRRKQVLIIECDSYTLEKQNLAIGNEVKTKIQGVFPRNGIDLIRATDKSSFDRELNVVLTKYKLPCKTIVLIGHSNQAGIKLTSDLFVNWQELGVIIEPFAPAHLIFLACRAGNMTACEILFDNIPVLRQIFASPINVPKSQQNIVIQKVLHTLSTQKESRFLINLMQTVNAVITKEWMFQRTREEHESGELQSKQVIENGIIMITNLFKFK